MVETNSYGDGDFGSADVVWVDDGTVDAGSYPTLSFYDCSGSGTVSVQFFAEPAAPVTYGGSSTYENGADELNDDDNQASSILPFISSSTGPYEAIVSVTQGAVELNISGIAGVEAETPVTSSATIPLGDLDVGQSYDLALDALDGPQADWTVSIAPVPVAISGVRVSPRSGRGGTPVTISYTVSGNTTLAAGVYAASGKLVDLLAAGLAVSEGMHTLTWGADGSNGAALAPGAYIVDLVSKDPQGHVSTGSGDFTIRSLTVPTEDWGLETRPAVINFTGDGTGFLGGPTGARSVGPRHHGKFPSYFGRLRWTSWGATAGRAEGVLWGNDCDPDCAAGTFTPTTVSVEVYRPIDGLFTRLKVEPKRGRTFTLSAEKQSGQWFW